jgi:NDP-sugar pyrophosphorylase family protein
MFQAMILAAGLGTRLKPLTDSMPKALVEVNGVSLLETNINKLINYGCNHIVINVHHFANQIIDHINNKHYNADIFISQEKDLLLDTGGGLVNAKQYFDTSSDILIHNVDIISKINFLDLYKFHSQNNSIATLAVSERETSRYLLFDKENNLCGWENTKTGEKIIAKEDKNLMRFGFSGIQFIKPGLINLINKEGSFPIIPEYLNLAKFYPIKSYLHSKDIWVDVGKLDAIEKAEKLLNLDS